jgi:hypothetical protein
MIQIEFRDAMNIIISLLNVKEKTDEIINILCILCKEIIAAYINKETLNVQLCSYFGLTNLAELKDRNAELYCKLRDLFGYALFR